MKIASILALTAAAVVSLGSAELKITEKNVKFGKSTFNVFKNGSVTLSDKTTYANIYLSIGTVGGWFSFGSKNANAKFEHPEKNLWRFNAIVPASPKNKNTLSVSQTIEATQMNEFEFDCDWKTPNMADASDVGLFLSIPMKFAVGKTIVLNDVEYKLENITKYGWFSKYLDKADVVFYKGDRDREFAVTIGKCRILFQSIKDQSVIIRFYPAAKSNSIKLTISPK